MARTVIKAGGVIDTPSMAELHQYFGTRDRERGRGVKHIRISGLGATPAAGTLMIPNGPESGYIWAVRLLSAQLATSGTVVAYITSSSPATGATPQRLVFNGSTSSTSQVTTFPAAACMLYSGESIYLSATQNITAFFFAAWEVPTEMEWKLL
jgi:hypothetical protein